MTGEYGRFRYTVGDRIGGRYRVERRASGGFGQVYLCYDEAEDFFVALKTLKLTPQALADPVTLPRLKREADLWIALGEHPHIVRCRSFTVVDELPFLVLEWVADDDLLSQRYQAVHQGKPMFLDWYARLGRQGLALRGNAERRNRERAGTTLAGWINTYERLPTELAVQIARDICAGVMHAQTVHPALVHRDLKPANILLTEQRRAKVSDFGIARLADDLLAGGDAFGTPEYVAPEVWQGAPPHPCADIYALGCILYAMLCGRPPFLSATGSRQELRVLHERVTPTLPRQLIPAPLDRIVEQCLAKSPEARFASWHDLDETLAAVAGCASVSRAAPEPVTVAEMNQVAVAYYHLEQYENALALFDRALALDPLYANSYTNRGCVYHVLGRYDEALADYAQAIRLGREAVNGKVRNNRALLYLARGEPQRALTDLRRALDKEPEYANAQVNLGLAHTLLGEYEQAVACFTRALEIAPQHVLAHHNRGVAYEQQGEEDAARADYDAALEHNPLFVAARVSRSVLCAKLGEDKVAAQDRARLRSLSVGRDVDGNLLPPRIELSRPDPQFDNRESLEEIIVRPFLEQRAARRWFTEEAFAEQPRQAGTPMQPRVRVRAVAYANELHPSILARQAKGERITQLTLQVQTLGADDEHTRWVCTVTLDREAMRKMEAAGLRTIDDWVGHLLILRRLHPDDERYPLHIEIVH